MLTREHLNLARYETKFVAQQAGFYRFKNWLLLHPYGFSSAHPERIVNNLYFDNIDCDAYWENLTGCSSRTKIRLRWYGENKSATRAILEIKSKKNRLGFKGGREIRFASPITELTYCEIIDTIMCQLDGDFSLRFKFCNVPVLINHYSREYYISHNQIIRATVDRDLTFYDQRDKHKPNFLHKSLAPEISIMEIKTPAVEIDLASEILGHIEFTPSKSSKYVIGVQSLLGYQ